EIHVAGAARFFTSSGNLLRQVCRWINKLRVLDVKIGEVNHFEPIVHCRIDVHGFAERVEQMYDGLRHEMPGGGFAGENEGARWNIGLWIAFQSQVERENV